MIPKIIHYCWLSDDPMPKDIRRYIRTWEKHLKGYEIIKWDFNRFPKNKSIWVSEAFDCKKYAFAADYLRLYALYQYGGIYLDSDVEVLKSFDAFLDLRTMMCFENTEGVGKDETFLEVAAFGVAKGEKWVADCLKYYEGRHFINDLGEMDMTTLPEIVMDSLINNGYVVKPVANLQEAKQIEGNEIPVLPYDYFSPKNLYTMKVTITENTCSIHNYKGSWSPLPFMQFLLNIGIKHMYAIKIYGKWCTFVYALKCLREGTLVSRLIDHFKKK